MNIGQTVSFATLLVLICQHPIPNDAMHKRLHRNRMATLWTLLAASLADGAWLARPATAPPRNPSTEATVDPKRKTRISGTVEGMNMALNASGIVVGSLNNPTSPNTNPIDDRLIWDQPILSSSRIGRLVSFLIS